ncbi:MAG: hypothetical protein OZSIB_3970 [Candidatus Ozemobacter sibiricus]|jgi:ComF family protein|uniref:ComF family protein n=1 Tax=Candidatus Ozemobacter sibiricus TaxID=2268124 RepID=A0A367ZP63_9BACT|nr:MAG: hypothetical protein OZSIB_3970 [Candidatus Ozemobacter sibiricus]
MRSFVAPSLVTDLAIPGETLALAPYEGVVAEAIKIAKYRPSRRTALRLAELAAAVAGPPWSVAAPDVFIPVPLHVEREAARGFNQAWLYALAVARVWNKPGSRALVRIKATRPQAECSEDERATNLAGAFALAQGLRPEAFGGLRLCLVDDVVTTGATLAACRNALLALRPRSVVALTLAHPPRLHPRMEEPGR